MNTCVTYCLHEDSEFLRVSLRTLGTLPAVVLVSQSSWHGAAGKWECCARIADECGAEVILGEWRSELEHRQAALEAARERGFTHALIVDGDEVIEPSLLDAMLGVAEAGLAERIYCEMDTYWKSPEYVIRPREDLTPCMLIDLEKAYPTGVREFEGGR